jgi:hypothetical protein
MGGDLFFTPMKKFIILVFCGVFFTMGCHSKDEAATYFSKSEQDTLMSNIITVISEKAPYSTDSTKYQLRFRAEYVKRLPVFHFIHLSKDSLGKFYYLLSRPVAGRADLRRGVLGTFTLKPNTLQFDQFEEIANTPHFDEETVKERGGFLFKELIKKGTIDEYMAMKHYVEWPDASLKYDKQKRAWVSTIGL